MKPFDGTLARKLDFGDWPAAVTSTAVTVKAGLRLAERRRQLAGPEKYRMLEHRRRTAQIRARHLLERMGSGD